ncbi:MAG TPA: hypothetical protein VLD39_03790 [Gammaproteobacteria bacterium]|nr:hypothetical protein [Gammaproteobacteria bacterium]
MRWRLLKLDLSYAIGELVIVTVGVLIALAVDGWNDNRLARVEELRTIDRLISDLQEDLERLGSQADALDGKEASLLRLRAVLFSAGSSDATPKIDPAHFLQDVVDGARYGRNQIEARRTTFGELLSSGRFGLIRDPELRELINEYYDFDTSVRQRIDSRETDFPSLSYLLVPREGEESAERVRDQATLDPSLTATELERLATRVTESRLAEELIGELNLARYIRTIGGRVDARCRELIARLERYRESLS